MATSTKTRLAISIAALSLCACSQESAPPVAPMGYSLQSSPPPEPMQAQAPMSAAPPVAIAAQTLSGVLGDNRQPWTARRAYLVRFNELTAVTTSTHPGQRFTVPESTMYVFDEDVSCAEMRHFIWPKDWHPGKHYVVISLFGTWPFLAGSQFQAGARSDTPTDLHVATHVSMNGADSSQGFTGPVRVVSSGGGRTVLDLDLSSPNRFGPNFGDLRGRLEVIDCIKPSPWVKP